MGPIPERRRPIALPGGHVRWTGTYERDRLVHTHYFDAGGNELVR